MSENRHTIEQLNNRRDNNVIRLKFPFISGKYETKIRKAIKNINISNFEENFTISPIFISEKPLKQMVLQTSRTSCGADCICNNNSQCNRKNIVYSITCSICLKFYIGETCRTFKARILEHTKSCSSHVYKHFMHTHNQIPSLNHIQYKILCANFQHTLHRKAHEYKMIKLLKPQLNIQNIEN